MPIDLPPTEVPAGWHAILAALRTHDVQYVIAGPAADAIVAGDPGSAAGLIVAPAPYRRNLERLAGALGSLTPRFRKADGAFDVSNVVNHPAVRWQLRIAETDLDIIGSCVGDGEFSIRLWRTRPVELVGPKGSVTAEVELTAEATTRSAPQHPVSAA